MSRGWKVCRSSASSIGMRVNSQPPISDFQGAWYVKPGWALATASCSWELGVGSLRSRVGCRHDRLHPAADGKIADDRHPPRLARGDEVVENLVGHRLVENAAVAEL